MKSLYIAFPQPNQVALCEEEVPAPRSGEVLCQALTSLISTGTELNLLAGRADPGTNWDSMMRYPLRPGYSMVARVVAAGDGVAGIRVGDRVHSRTPHQQHYLVPGREAYVLPDTCSDEEAIWLRLAGTTQLAARRAELKFGESVAVIGLGILGQLVVQYMALAGARRVIAIDTAAGRLALAASHGATHTICANVADAREQVIAITGGRMLDAVFDVTGHPAVLAPALLLLRRLGRLVLLGDTPTPSHQVLGPGVISNSLSILGIHGTGHPENWSEFAPWSRPEMYDLFVDCLAQGRMRVADLITHRFQANEAAAAYQLLVRDRTSALGVMLDWRGLPA